MAPFTKKQRFCRRFNGTTYFKPRGVPLSSLEINKLELDELEAIQLCDYEDLHQAEAAERMGVSTSTFQRLLYSGRRKVSDALYNSKAIEIIRHEQILERVYGRGRSRRGQCHRKLQIKQRNKNRK